MIRLIRAWRLSSVFISSSSLAHAKMYVIDFSPMAKYPSLNQEYQRSQARFLNDALPFTEHKRRFAIMQEMLQKEPSWLDAYWMLAAESFIMSSYYHEPSQFAEARGYLVQGLDSTGECLKKRASQPLCLFFFASVKAKIAAIDGIFASLKQGAEIRSMWEEVLALGVDFRFRPNSTLQGSVRYGLGLFHRVVPDLWIVDLMFKIRGNLDKSIDYHRQGLERDPNDPCAQLMLAVALHCKNKGKKSGPLFLEADHLLTTARRGRVTDLNQQLCVKHAPKIQSEPESACGYTQGKYQDTVTEEHF